MRRRARHRAEGQAIARTCLELAQSRKRLQAGAAGYSMSIKSIVLLLDLTQNTHNLRMYR